MVVFWGLVLESYEFYKKSCELAWKDGRVSHIQGKIIPAVDGEFGSHENKLIDARLSETSDKKVSCHPFWESIGFFDLEKVVKKNITIPKIENSMTFVDARMLYRQAISPSARSKIDFIL